MEARSLSKAFSQLKSRLQIKKTSIAGLFIVIFGGLMAYSGPAPHEKADSDKTLSPYFYVNSEDPENDRLPLKHTSADVNVAGVIADVVVKQVYVNEGQNPLEAIYVFPASTRAAVYAMQMTIGERVLHAKIQEREQARKTYEDAKEQGKTASLLEQQRPNVFQMNVANIMPGDSIVVELKYTESLVPEDGEYEFVYPTVVGPRYSDQPLASAMASDKWVSNPYQEEGEAPFYTFNLNASIRSGVPIAQAFCTSHEVDIHFDGPTKAAIQLKEEDKDGGNRDFILKYQLKGKQIESGVLMYEGEEENFFMAMVQPPKRVTPDVIPGREYIFIVDVSGSMNGFPLSISKDLLSDLIGNLRPKDRFNVLLFAADNSVLSETSLAANKANIKKAIDLIDRQRGGGGTQLLPALKRALALPKAEGYSRSVVAVTDGYVHVEKEAFDLIRESLGEANFFSFGIGSSVNRYIIEGMAHVGEGEPFVITKNSEAKEKANKFREYIQSPVLTNIKVDYDGLEVYDQEPYAIPDVLANRPIVISGKFKGSTKGKIRISGMSGEDKFSQQMDLAEASIGDENSALKYLWARKRIALLDDYSQFGNNDDIKQEVTQLGIKYNLLTAYTSFVAVDSEVRNENGELISVKQPLPLPEGVSNHAVGGAMNQQSYSTNVSGSTGSGLFKFKSAPRQGAPERSYESLEALDLEEKEEEEPAVFHTVEIMPEFPGGQAALEAYLKKQIRYPKALADKGISGTVYVKFTVDEKGRVTDVEVVRGVHEELDKESLRVIREMPKWTAGEQRGKKVKVQMTIPVKFEL